MTETEPAENAPCLFSLFFKSIMFFCYYDYTRAVTILDFSYHGYCGHNNSQYRHIAICIEILGGEIYQSNNFLLCLLSFYF